MSRFFIVLFFLGLFCGDLYALSTERDSLFSQMTILSSRYLNYNCSVADDSVIKICEKVIESEFSQDDDLQKFRAKQLIVNALCLKGNIGQGINMAKEMYQEAKVLDYSLGKALSLQALGAAYMYTGQYQKALSTYLEAQPVIFSKGDTLAQIKLLVQQLHTCMKLKDTLSMVTGLAQLYPLLKNVSPELKETYQFYMVCYETGLGLIREQQDSVQLGLEKMSQLLPKDNSLNIWRYYMQTAFYKMIGDDKQALSCFDSVIHTIRQAGNTNEYKNLMYEKAYLLEKMEDHDEACKAYTLADSLANILNIQEYAEQMEYLHLTYYVDQVAIENAKMYNELLTDILICVLICIIISALLIIMAKKRNKQLMLSRKKLEEIRQLTADSIQSKSMFLSNMSHDLRTPLNAIVGFSEILVTMDEISPEIKQQSREYIKQNSDLLMKLINDIVDFSSLKEAKIKFDFQKHDVVTLCRNVLETVAKVKQTEAELIFTSTVDQLEIETDNGRLQQVLINLLTNATKFTKTGEIRLILNFNASANEAVFIVQDTGCGIPLEKQTRIFERFEKLYESVQGIGLGLSICKLIVDHVNGRIWIDSSYTEGAKFVFTHPVSHIPKQEEI